MTEHGAGRDDLVVSVLVVIWTICLSTVRDQLPTTNYQLPTTNYQLPNAKPNSQTAKQPNSQTISRSIGLSVRSTVNQITIKVPV